MVGFFDSLGWMKNLDHCYTIVCKLMKAVIVWGLLLKKWKHPKEINGGYCMTDKVLTLGNVIILIRIYSLWLCFTFPKIWKAQSEHDAYTALSKC